MNAHDKVRRVALHLDITVPQPEQLLLGRTQKAVNNERKQMDMVVPHLNSAHDITSRCTFPSDRHQLLVLFLVKRDAWLINRLELRSFWDFIDQPVFER